MHRPLAVLLVLYLISGASRECACAERTGPLVRAESDAAEVTRGEPERGLERSDDRFLPYAGKRVGRIRIKTLPVFGASVDDTTRVTDSWLLRFLNHANFETREITIRRSLLFQEGDVIDPIRMADSERILRSLAFIRDARIVVTRSSEIGDSTDVLVLAKEAWSLMLSGGVKKENQLKVRLADRNVLGLGHQISGAMTFIPDARPQFVADYSVQNIRGSFVTGELEYASRPDRSSAGLALSRDLVSPALEYAGGLDLRRIVIAAEDSLSSTDESASVLIDAWAGRRFHLGLRQKGVDRRRILFVSARIRHLDITSHPPVTPPAVNPYHDVRHVLGSIAVIQNRYYRTSLLYDFGRTEDVPYGFLARFTGGWADEASARRTYTAVTLAAGERIDRLGYGVGEVRVGGYPGAGRIREGVIRLRSLYFSDLLPAGGFRFRQFLTAEYTTGIHRSAGESIDFSGEESIRGVTYNGGVTGRKRLQLGLETVAFTPWKVLGVTSALFAFADVDVIGSGGTSILQQEFYSGLGLGMRLHREAYGITPIQLRFAWYPRLPVDHDKYAYTVFGEKRFRSVEFPGSGPEIVDY